MEWIHFWYQNAIWRENKRRKKNTYFKLFLFCQIKPCMQCLVCSVKLQIYCIMMSSKMLIYVMIHFQSKWFYWYMNALNVQMIEAYLKNVLFLAERDLQPCQLSNMEGLTKIFNRVRRVCSIFIWYTVVPCSDGRFIFTN